MSCVLSVLVQPFCRVLCGLSVLVHPLHLPSPCCHATIAPAVLVSSALSVLSTNASAAIVVPCALSALPPAPAGRVQPLRLTWLSCRARCSPSNHCVCRPRATVALLLSRRAVLVVRPLNHVHLSSSSCPARCPSSNHHTVHPPTPCCACCPPIIAPCLWCRVPCALSVLKPLRLPLSCNHCRFCCRRRRVVCVVVLVFFFLIGISISR